MHWVPSHILNLCTHSDYQGATYTFLAHLLPDVWRDVTKVKGHPTWEVKDDDIEMVINEGPAYLAMDPCKISYDMLRFQGNVTGRCNYRTGGKSVLHVFPYVDVDRENSVEWARVGEGDLVLIHHITPCELPRLIVLHVERTLVRVTSESVWVIERKNTRLGPPVTPYDASGVDEHHGFSSAREALDYAIVTAGQATGCYSTGTWVASRLGASPADRRELHAHVDEAYSEVYRRFSALSENGAFEQPDTLRKVMQDLLYWSWVHTCGMHSPDEVARCDWVAATHVAVDRRPRM